MIERAEGCEDSAGGELTALGGGRLHWSGSNTAKKAEGEGEEDGLHYGVSEWCR
jgi:hypothetical protein